MPVNAAVEAYMNDGTLPAAGTKCTQAVPFAAPEPEPAAKSLAVRTLVNLQPRLRTVLQTGLEYE